MKPDLGRWIAEEEVTLCAMAMSFGKRQAKCGGQPYATEWDANV